MRNRLYIISILLISLLSSSCKDFLEKTPETSIPEGEAMTTLSDAIQVNTGIYSQLLVNGLYSSQLTILPDIQADFILPVVGYSNTTGHFFRWDILPNNTYVANVYASLYKLISRCNFFLDNEDKVRENISSKEDKRTMDQLTADAYFLRALAYSELIRLWCEDYDPADARNQLGVSIVTSYKEKKTPIRSSLFDSYQLVRGDINRADSLFTVTETNNLPNSVVGNTAAVWSLGARVCLYMKDYDKAAEYATNVIEEKNYSLANAFKPYATYGGQTFSEYGIMWLFDESSEVIFRIGMTENDLGASLSTPFHRYNYVNYLPNYIPAPWVYNLYSSNDYRRGTFFSAVVETGYPHGLQTRLVTKYFTNPNLDGNTGRMTFCNMPKVFRLSEQYLIRAEAYYNLNRPADAMADLNILRAERIDGYTNQNLTGEALFDAIKTERIKELYMEGFRLMDLKRWHEGFTRTPEENTVAPANSLTVDKDDPLFTWPIPQHEMTAVKGMQPNKSNT